MSSDDELPNEIKKLKITPMEANEVKGKVFINPFYDDYNIPKAETQLEENTPHSRCRRCRLRRRSESLVDEYKTHNQIFGECGVDVAQHVARPCKHSAHNKHTLKRTVISTSGDRKIYMREPMLRALQRFCTQKQVRRKLLLSQEQESALSSVSGIVKDKRAPEDPKDKFPARGMSDFRDLIEECHSMLEKYTDSHKLPEQKTQQFQCHRTTPGEDNEKEKTLEVPSLHNISISEQNVVSTRSSVSCSQQAGNSNVPCDDVTIDELASYFDTFVHIPKKMSTMAEMMYI